MKTSKRGGFLDGIRGGLLHSMHPHSKSVSRSVSGILLALAILIVLSCLAASASPQVTIITAPGCHKCAAADSVLTQVLADYGDIPVQDMIFSSDEGRKYIKEHKVKDVPSIVIGNSVIGYRDYNGNETELEELITVALHGQNVTKTAQNPVPTEDDSINNLAILSISSSFTVFAAGILAGFNPCLLAILAFLASTVLASSSRKRDLLAVVASFSLGIFVVYYIFGVGLFQVMQDKSLEVVFRSLLSLVLLVMGFIQIEDARRMQGGGRSLFKTDWMMQYFEGATESRNLLSYFLLGALFSLVKAPCVGAVYMAIIGVISEHGYSSAGLVYLLLYNLGVILPVFLLGGGIALGMSPEQVDIFRHRHRVAIRLITGATLLALAPLIYWQLI